MYKLGMAFVGDKSGLSNMGFKGDVRFVNYENGNTVIDVINESTVQHDLVFYITSTSPGAEHVYTALKGVLNKELSRLPLCESVALKELSGVVVCSWVEYTLHTMMNAMLLGGGCDGIPIDSCVILPAGDDFCREVYRDLPFEIGKSSNLESKELNLYLSLLSLVSDFKKNKNEKSFVAFCKEKMSEVWSPELQSMSSSLIHALDKVYQDMDEGVDYVFYNGQPVLLDESTSSFRKEPSHLYQFLINLKHGSKENLLVANPVTINLSMWAMLKSVSSVIFLEYNESLSSISNPDNTTYVDSMDVQSINLNECVKKLRGTNDSLTYIIVDEKMKSSMVNLPNDLIVISHAEFCDKYMAGSLVENVILMSIPKNKNLSNIIATIVVKSGVIFHGVYSRSSSVFAGHVENQLIGLVAKLNTQSSKKMAKKVLGRIFCIHEYSPYPESDDELMVHNMALELLLNAGKFRRQKTERMDLYIKVSSIIESFSASSESGFLYSQVSNSTDTPIAKAKKALKIELEKLYNCNIIQNKKICI